MMARILDVPHTDVLALLERVGRDTSGALSFSLRGTAADTVVPIESEADLEKILNELPAKPFLVGEEGVSMSLAGVQGRNLLVKGRFGSLTLDLVLGGQAQGFRRADAPHLRQGLRQILQAVIVDRAFVHHGFRLAGSALQTRYAQGRLLGKTARDGGQAACHGSPVVAARPLIVAFHVSNTRS